MCSKSGHHQIIQYMDTPGVCVCAHTHKVQHILNQRKSQARMSTTQQRGHKEHGGRLRGGHFGGKWTLVAELFSFGMAHQLKSFELLRLLTSPGTPVGIETKDILREGENMSFQYQGYNTFYFMLFLGFIYYCCYCFVIIICKFYFVRLC